jgi:hypothetical protein
MNGPEDAGRPRERGLDGRALFLIAAAFVMGLVAFYVVDNYDYIVGTRLPADEWNRIDTRIVESSCLDQARKVAVSEGYSDSFVLGCSCLNVESEIIKTFDCSVNTIDVVDPSRKVLVHCYRTSSTCTVASDRGLQTYNLSELEQYIVQ